MVIKNREKIKRIEEVEVNDVLHCITNNKEVIQVVVGKKDGRIQIQEFNLDNINLFSSDSILFHINKIFNQEWCNPDILFNFINTLICLTEHKKKQTIFNSKEIPPTLH